jgi:hypothetical protein
LVELLGQRLHEIVSAGGLELVEAAQIHRQPIGGELGDRLCGRLPLVLNSQRFQNSAF